MYTVIHNNLYNIVFGFMPVIYAIGLKHALQNYSDPEGKTVEELLLENPKQKRQVKLPTCLIAVAILLLVTIYAYSLIVGQHSLLTITSNSTIVYCIFLTVACLLSIYTDYKYAVIGNLITIPTIILGLVINSIRFYEYSTIDNLLMLVNFAIYFVVLLATTLIFKKAIGGGDIKLFLAIVLGIPNNFVLSLSILTCGLALLSYVIKGFVSLHKTKKWTGDKTVRLGIWLGISTIIHIGIYISTLYI